MRLFRSTNKMTIFQKSSKLISISLNSPPCNLSTLVSVLKYHRLTFVKPAVIEENYRPIPITLFYMIIFKLLFKASCS